MNKKNQLVIVEWEDAWSSDGWLDSEVAQEEAKNQAKVVTVGYVIKHDKSGISLAQGVGLHKGQTGYSGIFNIPAGMIIKITKVNTKNG